MWYINTIFRYFLFSNKTRSENYSNMFKSTFLILIVTFDISKILSNYVKRQIIYEVPSNYLDSYIRVAAVASPNYLKPCQGTKIGNNRSQLV